MSNPETPLHQFDADRPAPAVPEAPPIDEFAFDDSVKEEQFQQAWHVLRTTDDPRAKPSWWLFLFILGIAAFVTWQGGQFSAEQLAWVAAVIAFHDLGHFLAMKAFGYTDGKLFFIPLFAAAVQGRRHAAPAWQQALTVLMGPLPGLLMALGLYATFRDDSPALVLRLVILLTFINGLNLLPLGMTDAGRLLNLVVYSRNAWIETLMQLVSAGLFAFLAYWQHNYVLAGLAVLMVLSAPMVFRTGRMIARLRREGLQMPDTVAALDPIHGRMLFAATYDVLGRMNVTTLASLMRQLHDRVLVPAPGFLATVGFLLLYLSGWIMVIGTSGMILQDYMHLTQLATLQGKAPEYQWKRDADDLRRRARRLRGPAKLEAEAKAKELDQRFKQWHEGVVQKVMMYHDAFFMMPPAVGNDPDDDPGDKDE
jgi:hypothetical protein